MDSSSVAEYFAVGERHEIENTIGEITTFTGKRVYPMAMTPGMICIEDIAHGLSRVCRFAGQCAGFLSVAEHSVLVARIVQAGDHPELALEALLHDASEAYLGDMPRPIKHLPEMQPYRDAEARAEQAIATKFGLVYPMPQVIKDADRVQLFREFEYRQNPSKATMPEVAKGAFLAIYRSLVEERKKFTQLA